MSDDMARALSMGLVALTSKNKHVNETELNRNKFINKIQTQLNSLMISIQVHLNSRPAK